MILHIGAHKTGTSSIQRFLKQNTIALGNKGWQLFCRKPEGINSKDGSANSWIEFEGKSESLSANINAGIYAQLQYLGKNVIVSSEELFWLNDRRKIKALFTSLSDIFDNITVVCYLRRQDQHLYSHYQQGFKFPESSARAFYGNDVSQIPEHMIFFKSYLDYSAKLDVWSEFFGRENILVREYSANSLLESDSVKDFASLLPFETSQFDFSTKKVNESLNKTQIIVNNAVFSIRSELWYELGKSKFTKSSTFMNIKAETKTTSNISYPKIMEHYYESNRRLLKYIESVPDEWLNDNKEEPEVLLSGHYTVQDYQIALESTLKYFDDLPLYRFFAYRLKKHLKFRMIEKYFRNLLFFIFDRN